MIRAALLAVCVALASPAFAQSAIVFDEANAKADAQAESEATAAYANAWAAFNNQNHLDERDGCYFKADGELTQILEIDASGKVVGYFADKDNGRSQCWRNTYLGVVFPKPPFAPYWHRLVMH
jgi:hypothetical protein